MAAPTPSRRPAALARAAATGISVVGAVAMVGVLNASAQNNSASDTADTQPPADPAVTDSAGAIVTEPRPTVVIEVHRTVYVDEHGNPVDPSAVTAPPVGTDSPTGTTVRRRAAATRPPRSRSCAARSPTGR